MSWVLAPASSWAEFGGRGVDVGPDAIGVGAEGGEVVRGKFSAAEVMDWGMREETNEWSYTQYAKSCSDWTCRDYRSWHSHHLQSKSLLCAAQS